MENLMEVPVEPKLLRCCPWRDVNTKEGFVNKESLGSWWALLSVQVKFGRHLWMPTTCHAQHWYWGFDQWVNHSPCLWGALGALGKHPKETNSRAQWVLFDQRSRETDMMNTARHQRQGKRTHRLYHKEEWRAQQVFSRRLQGKVAV